MALSIWLTGLAAAQSSEWAPPGTFAEPWDPATVGDAELFVMSGGGAEWLVVRQQGRTLEGAAAFVAVAATPQATPAILARIACATVDPGILGVVPWTAPSPAVADELEALASVPRATERDLRYWVAQDANLVELVISRAGTVTGRHSATEILRLRRERYDRSLLAAHQATTPERAALAMHAMEETDDPRTSTDFADLAHSHPLYGARVTALELLARRRGPAALDVVAAAVSDPVPEVRVAAVKLLGRMGAGARPALEVASGNPDARVREAAALAWPAA